MKPKSAKAKGRVAAQETADLLYKYAPDLSPGDVLVTSAGSTGEDVLLSPAARELYPFFIECKNTETLSLWAAYKQACEHAKGRAGYPTVFFRRNRSELMVCLSAEHFMKLVR